MTNVISFKEMMKNKKLTIYQEMRESVIANYVKEMDEIKKKKAKGRNLLLSEVC